ncbi:MAG: cell division protein ZapA [Defluviicoccus sp.]|nr:cell division protein ZapA [Defluviicoccus sp.]MDE0277350.1 cell division protein ZapA [Defluviicoccus sp.]
MPEVDVTINGRNYLVACEAGEEERLSELAAYIDDRVETLVSSLGQIGDNRLLVMTCLMIADELAEAYAALSEAGLATPEQDEPKSAIEDARKSVAARIQDAAVRIETIAEEVARS